MLGLERPDGPDPREHGGLGRRRLAHQGWKIVTGVTDFYMGCWVVQAEEGTKTTYCSNELG